MPRRLISLGRLTLCGAAGMLLHATCDAASLTEWEPVTLAELQQTRSLIETGADAEMIFRHEWVEDHFSTSGIDQTRDVYVRIKVLTPAGAQRYAKISILFPRRGARVSDVRARTIQPDGTIVPVAKRAVVEETAVKAGREGVMRRNFAVPSVQPGSLVEYRYRLDLTESRLESRTYQFQYEIPAQKVAFHVKPLDAPGYYVRTQMFHTSASTPSDRVDGYYDFTATHQRAYVEEPDGPPELQLRGWMMMFYTQEDLVAPEVYWPKLGKRLAAEFDGDTRPDAVATRLAKEITYGHTSEPARLAAITRWLETNFRIVHSDSPDSLKSAKLRSVDTGREALSQRGGTHENASYAFATLTRAAGLETRLLRVPSREEFFFERKVMMHPTFVRFVQVLVRLDGEWRSFDVGQQYLPVDMFAWGQEAQLALLCDRDSSRFIETGTAPPERSELQCVAELALDETGTLEGEVLWRTTGHENDRVRALFEDVEGAEIDSTVRKYLLGDPGLELSRVRVRTGENARAPLEIRCHVRLVGHATITGKRLLLDPVVFQSRIPARFTSSTRSAPVYFEYGWSELDTVRLRLPSGWVPEAMEPPAPVVAPGIAEYDAQIAISSDGRELQVVRLFRMGENGTLFFPAKEYPQVKRLFDQVHDRDRTSVTLTRRESRP